MTVAQPVCEKISRQAWKTGVLGGMASYMDAATIVSGAIGFVFYKMAGFNITPSIALANPQGLYSILCVSSAMAFFIGLFWVARLRKVAAYQQEDVVLIDNGVVFTPSNEEVS